MEVLIGLMTYNAYADANTEGKLAMPNRNGGASNAGRAAASFFFWPPFFLTPPAPSPIDANVPKQKNSSYGS